MTNGHTVSYSILGVFLLTFASLTSTGCSTEPKRVDADYGNSIHQMVQAATFNPEAAASTESIPVYGMDGKRAMNSLDAMTTDTEKRIEDFNEILDLVEFGSN